MSVWKTSPLIPAAKPNKQKDYHRTWTAIWVLCQKYAFSTCLAPVWMWIDFLPIYWHTLQRYMWVSHLRITLGLTSVVRLYMAVRDELKTQTALILKEGQRIIKVSPSLWNLKSGGAAYSSSLSVMNPQICGSNRHNHYSSFILQLTWCITEARASNWAQCVSLRMKHGVLLCSVNYGKDGISGMEESLNHWVGNVGNIMGNV